MLFLFIIILFVRLDIAVVQLAMFSSKKGRTKDLDVREDSDSQSHSQGKERHGSSLPGSGE